MIRLTVLITEESKVCWWNIQILFSTQQESNDYPPLARLSPVRRDLGPATLGRLLAFIPAREGSRLPWRLESARADPYGGGTHRLRLDAIPSLCRIQ
jgi:hypothetical protein